MNFSTLEAGIATERRLIVDKERTISFLGRGLAHLRHAPVGRRHRTDLP